MSPFRTFLKKLFCLKNISFLLFSSFEVTSAFLLIDFAFFSACCQWNFLVPCLETETKKVILESVPLHGDQLFEERARNTAWTFRDGIDEYERLEGIGHEHADWHAKMTLYKVNGFFFHL